MNTVQSLSIMANLDRSVLNVIDLTEAGREMALINGCPAKLLRSADEIDQLVQQQTQSAQLEQLAAGAPQVSMAEKNLAQAAQARAEAGATNAAA